jgi:DNA-binding response OmpR family regulator
MRALPWRRISDAAAGRFGAAATVRNLRSPTRRYPQEFHVMQIGVEASRLVENKRVFVVDEDDITRTVLQFMLHDDNETHELGSLSAAYAKGDLAAPDLVMLGLSIVKASGPEVMQAIAARWPNVRILLVSEPNDGAAAGAFLKHGAHGVVTKPFTVEAVRRKVDIALGRIQPTLVQLQLAPAGSP